MLVLTRKLGESIAIDDHIKIRIVQIKGKQVRIGIEAPKDTKIHREEVYVAIQEQNKQSVAVLPARIGAIGLKIGGLPPPAEPTAAGAIQPAVANLGTGLIRARPVVLHSGPTTAGHESD